MKSVMPYNFPNICYTCKANCKTDVHHIFQGSNHDAADRFGLTCNLCRICHNRAHIFPKQFEEKYHLKSRAQFAAMSKYHWNIDELRKLFRKDYR